MHPVGKIISGLILILAGLALYAMPALQVVNWLDNFIILVTGSIPILLIIIGLFVVWLEADELKVSKDLQEEESREKKKDKTEERKSENKEAKPKRKKKARKRKTTKKTPTPEKPKEDITQTSAADGM